MLTAAIKIYWKMSFGHVNGKYGFVNGCEYYKGEKTDSVLNCIHFRRMTWIINNRFALRPHSGESKISCRSFVLLKKGT